MAAPWTSQLPIEILLENIQSPWLLGRKMARPPSHLHQPGLHLPGFHLPSSSPCLQEVAGRGYLHSGSINKWLSYFRLLCMRAQKKLTKKIGGEGDESSTDLATSGKGGVADVPLPWQQEDRKSPLVAGSGKCWSQDYVAHWWLTFKWIEIVKKKVFSFYCMNLQNIIHSHHMMSFHHSLI